MTTLSALSVATPLVAQARFPVGRVNLSCVDRPMAVETFFALASVRAGGYVTITDANSIVAAQTDPTLRAIINSGWMALPDGMPSVWLGKLKGYPVSRVAGGDFLRSVLADPRARALRHFVYGGQPETADHIVSQLSRQLGPEAIVARHVPPFREVGAIEDDAVIAQIAAAEPDVIWVGLGAPKQEYWMANHSRFFPHAILVGIGAGLDFHVGLRNRAPKWMQSVGLEWLYRVLQEPRRLLPRYRRVVPGMLRIMVAEAMRR